MSIRKEHLEAFDSAFSSLNDAISLGKEIAMSKDDLTEKISKAAEEGLGAIQGIAQGYQSYKTLKAIHTAKKAANAIKNATNEAKTTDTGNEETPEPNQDTEQTARNTDNVTERAVESPEGENSTVAETSFMSPEAEQAARQAQQLEPGLGEGVQEADPAIEAFRDRIPDDLFERLQQTGLSPEGGLPEDIYSEVVNRALGRSGDFPETETPEEFGEPRLIDAGEEARQTLAGMTDEEYTMQMIEAAGITQRRAAARAAQAGTTAAEETTEAPEVLDQLAPMRELYGIGRRTETAGEMMGQRATDAENIASRAEGGAEELVDVGADAGANVGSAITSATTAAGEAAGAAGEAVSAAAGAAGKAVSGVSEAISGVSDALDIATAATAEIPVVGEVVGVIAGIGSIIASAFGAGDKKTAPTPVVNQVGGDFSNNDEHGGENLAAY